MRPSGPGVGVANCVTCRRPEAWAVSTTLTSRRQVKTAAVKRVIRFIAQRLYHVRNFGVAHQARISRIMHMRFYNTHGHPAECGVTVNGSTQENTMPLQIIVGTQWGDEGKGRIVDWFAAGADVVARYNGGDNAGHSVTVGSQLFKLHLIPSGIIHPHPVAVLGNGMV